MLRLYMDVHVKAAITAGLRRRSIDVVTAQEDGSSRLDDEALLTRATTLQRVLFSQDDDLLAIARERQATGVFFSGLIYGHQLAATVGKYVLDLEVVCLVLDPLEGFHDLLCLDCIFYFNPICIRITRKILAHA